MKIINTIRNKYHPMYIKPTMRNHLYFFSKAQILFWSWEGLGLSALLMLIYARFEFDLVIYCNFCSFWVSFIYWWWFVVLLLLVDYSILFLLIVCFMKFFTFLSKTYFVEKVFLINFCSFFIDIFFSWNKKRSLP